MKKIIAACLLSCICFASLYSQPINKVKNKDVPVVDDAAKTRINTVLKSFVDSGTIAGVSALIYEKGEEVYFNAFGYANREDKTPMDRNTIVRIYSMTKPLTGVALMGRVQGSTL